MFIILTTVLVASAKAMSMCDYYEKIGVHKAECGHALPSPTVIQNIPIIPNIPKSAPPAIRYFESLPICRHYFHSCMSSSRCESGTICSNGSGQGSCCTDPSRSRCPSVTALNINCRKTRGVNWCNSDDECRGSSTMASMCCPTGCNYNMCIHVGVAQPISYLKRMTFSSYQNNENESCPDPYTLNVKCVATKTTSWCHTDGECPQNSIYSRKCCPTLCGYNTCVTRYNGVWQIA